VDSGQVETPGMRVTYGMLLKNFAFALIPLALTVGTLYATWWYVVIHR